MAGVRIQKSSFPPHYAEAPRRGKVVCLVQVTQLLIPENELER